MWRKKNVVNEAKLTGQLVSRKKTTKKKKVLEQLQGSVLYSCETALAGRLVGLEAWSPVLESENRLSVLHMQQARHSFTKQYSYFLSQSFDHNPSPVLCPPSSIHPFLLIISFHTLVYLLVIWALLSWTFAAREECATWQQSVKDGQTLATLTVQLLAIFTRHAYYRLSDHYTYRKLLPFRL